MLSQHGGIHLQKLLHYTLFPLLYSSRRMSSTSLSLSLSMFYSQTKKYPKVSLYIIVVESIVLHIIIPRSCFIAVGRVINKMRRYMRFDRGGRREGEEER